MRTEKMMSMKGIMSMVISSSIVTRKLIWSLPRESLATLTSTNCSVSAATVW